MARPETIAAMREALAWLSLLGDHIGNGVTEDRHRHGVPLGPMGRCNTIGRLRDAIQAEQESPPTPDGNALDTIAALLNGEDWTPDHLEQVADVIRSTGRTIADA